MNNIDEKMKWALYRGMVCHVLTERGYKDDAWQLADALDMSFDEIKDMNYSLWPDIISYDCDEFMRESPHLFE